jgi:hypothetical protein
MDPAKMMKKVERTFELIRQRTDMLLATLGLME